MEKDLKTNEKRIDVDEYHKLKKVLSAKVSLVLYKVIDNMDESNSHILREALMDYINKKYKNK
jgi:hypothetical protein